MKSSNNGLSGARVAALVLLGAALAGACGGATGVGEDRGGAVADGGGAAPGGWRSVGEGCKQEDRPGGALCQPLVEGAARCCDYRVHYVSVDRGCWESEAARLRDLCVTAEICGQVAAFPLDPHEWPCWISEDGAHAMLQREEPGDSSAPAQLGMRRCTVDEQWELIALPECGTGNPAWDYLLR